jgi:seryl-tRNA synthetase
MNKKFIAIARPQDPYSKDWLDYNRQNPHLHRSVGGDGDNEGTPDIKELQDTIDKMQTSMDTLKTQNENLQASNQKWEDKHNEAEKHRKKQEKEAQEKADEAARASGDIEALTNSWTTKYNELETSSGEEISSLKNIIKNLTVTATAESIASKIAMEGCAEIIQPHIERRLYGEIKDGQALTKVYSEDGKVSALTIDDLAKEFSENKKFEKVMRGSSASGGGGTSESGGGVSGDNVIKRSEFDKMNPTQQALHMSKKGAGVVD